MVQEKIFPSRRREKSYFMALAGKEFKMKKSRRMIALILVFAFVFAFMVMSASAATTVMPRATCTNCGSGDCVYHTNATYLDTWYDTCSKNSRSHQHADIRYQNLFTCRSCGHAFPGDRWTVYDVCLSN